MEGLHPLTLSHDGSVVPFVQPIVHTKTKDIVGGEFLMRISLEDQLYTPFHFLESAVYFGLIDRLESMMLNSISKYDFRKGLLLFLNRTITKDEKVEIILKDSDLLEKIALSKGVNFVIEITENSLFENIDRIKGMISESKDRKINFAIDDFGSGYTSLRYLYDLEEDFLKIDGSLIKDIKNQPKKKSILEGIASISKSLGIKTIAEYVETEDDYRYCLDIGIDFCQGYYFYRPMDIETFLRLTT